MKLFSSISVHSGSWNSHSIASHVGEISATIYLDFREQLTTTLFSTQMEDYKRF